MENQFTTAVMTRRDRATSMSVTDILALSPSNRLTPAERKAISQSDHKASKVLGVTLTRNRVRQLHHDRRLSLCPSQDQENAQGDNIHGESTTVSAKHPHNRNASTATVIGPLKVFGRVLASGMGMIEKRNKNRIVAERYTQRVVLGLLSNESPSKEGKKVLPAGVGDDSACSLPELDESEDTTALLGAEFLGRNNEEGDDDLSSSFQNGLVGEVEDSSGTPPSPILEQRVEMRLNETIGPIYVSPVASLRYTTDFEVSSQEERPALSSDDSFGDMLRPVERAYLDFLMAQDEAQDEAEEQSMKRGRERRVALRSRNKILDVLGAEARQAVDEQC